MEILFTIAYRTESGNYMFHRSECLYIAQSSAVINVIASVLELSTRIIDINNWFYGGLCEWFHLESFDRRWEGSRRRQGAMETEATVIRRY